MDGYRWSDIQKGRRTFYKDYKKNNDPVKKVLMLDPTWTATDTRNGTHLIESEKKAARFNELIDENAKLAKVELETFSINTLDSSKNR